MSYEDLLEATLKRVSEVRAICKDNPNCSFADVLAFIDLFGLPKDRVKLEVAARLLGLTEEF